jgi:glycosyltransferase involved in cell wall biosynthesis
VAARPSAIAIMNRLPFPLDDGWKVRTFHVLRQLALRADTTALLFHRTPDDPALGDFLAALPPGVQLETVPPPPAYTPLNLVRGLVTSTPVHAWNMRSPELTQALDRILRGRTFDVGLAVYGFMAPHLLDRPQVRRVLIDTHNIDSVLMSRYIPRLQSLPRRWYAGVTARAMAAFEHRTFARAHAVMVCSDQERELLQARGEGANVRVVPNGVDVAAADRHADAEVPERVLFFGKLDYFPNVDGLDWFFTEILPRLQAVRPGVEVQIIGGGASASLQARCANTPGVHLLGAVADVWPHLASAAVAVVPLRIGGGTRLKVLEALAARRAIVSTVVGAEGIGVSSGRNIELVDDPEGFATTVAALLEDGTRRRRLGNSGHDLVAGTYDWNVIGERLAPLLTA